MPGTDPGTASVAGHRTNNHTAAALSGGESGPYHCLQFAEETEAQSSYATCPRSHSGQAAERGFESRQPGSGVSPSLSY